MADPLTNAGDALEQARGKRETYRSLLGLSLVYYLVLGIAALAAPAVLCGWLQRPVNSDLGVLNDLGWVRIAGAMFLTQIVFYLPGWQDPTRSRYVNVFGVPLRLLLGLVLIVQGGGLALLGVIELVWAVVLGFSYLRFAEAEVMNRP